MKRIKILTIILMLMIALTACGKAQEPAKSQEENKTAEAAPTEFTVTDATGREIFFESVPEKAVAIGHGMLKFYTYICGEDHLVGLEATETKGHTLNGQSIHYAYPKLRDIEIVGNGGPKFAPDYELLSYNNPDVIFVAYGNTAEELDAMQEKLGIPIVGVSGGKSGIIFDEDAYQTFEIIGKTLNKEKRAEELIAFMKSAQEDLKSRAGNIEESPKAYVGGCSFRGEQGILSTKTNNELFTATNVHNIMDDITNEPSIIIDKEKLIEINPDLIIFDLSGKAKVMDEMATDPEFFKSLNAFNENKVYPIMPYFTYGMNFDTAILDAYYVGKTVYPDKFKDINIEDKAKEIYEMFVGKDVYNELMEYYPESFKEFKFED